MKARLSRLLVVALVLLLAGCGGGAGRRTVEIEFATTSSNADATREAMELLERLALRGALEKRFPRLTNDSNFVYSEIVKADGSGTRSVVIVVSVRSSDAKGDIVYDQEAMDFVDGRIRDGI